MPISMKRLNLGARSLALAAGAAQGGKGAGAARRWLGLEPGGAASGDRQMGIWAMKKPMRTLLRILPC
jgi:hypothetical protein